VVLVPDTGRGYISKIFNDDWHARLRLLDDRKRSDAAGDILDVKGANATDLILATTDQSVREVTGLMRDEVSPRSSSP